MKIAVLQFDLVIHDAQALKDKRRVVQSLKDRLHRDHQVSIAEVGMQDDMGTARLGLAAVGTDVAYLQSMLDRILDKVRSVGEASLGTVFREILHGDNSGGLGLGTADDVDDFGAPLWDPEERRT